MITDALINRTLSYLHDDIDYIGVGVGTTPTDTSTTLDGEANRKQAEKLIDGNTLVLEIFFDESEANGGVFTNAGAFGNGSTEVIASGELFAGGAISVLKTNTQSLTVSVEITVERA